MLLTQLRTKEEHKYYQTKNYCFLICWVARVHDFVHISDVEERSGEGFISERCAASNGGWVCLAIHFQIHLNCRLGMKMKNFQHSIRIIKHW